MSDLMLFGVLRMPYDSAMATELSRRQFYDRAQEAADRLEVVLEDRERFRKEAYHALWPNAKNEYGDQK